MFGHRTPDDAHAVRLVLSGQRAAFGVLVERYEAMMQAVAYAQTGNHTDAEDAVQNAFIKAFTSLSTLRDTRRLGPWLASITRNEAKQIQRRAAIAANALAQNGAHDIASGSDAEEHDMHELLRRNVMALEESQREVLLMHYFAERSTAEIAEDLGISRDAVKKRLERARAALGERIAAEVGELLGPKKSKQERAKQVMAAVAGLPAPYLAAPAGGSTLLPAILKGGLVMQTTSKWALTVGALLILAGLCGVIRARWTSAPSDLPDTPAVVSSAPIEMAAPVEEPRSPQTGSQTSSTAPSVPNPALRGHVFDQDTKAGIAHVEVVAKLSGALEGSEVTAQTDEKGAYAFDFLPPGEYEVKRGDTPEGWRQATWNDPAIQVNVESGKVAENVDFLVAKEAPFDGTVVDSSGNPVMDAKVYMGGGIDIYTSDKAQTDEAGHFTFHGLTPTGGLFVIARKDAQISAVTEFELPPSGLHGMILTLEDGAYISGKVVDTEGRALPDMQVYSRPVEDSRIGADDEAITNSAGEFTAGPFAAGGYRLILRPKDEMAHIGQDEGELFEVASGERLEGVILTYDRMLSIAGRVTDEVGNPIAGALISGNAGMQKTDADGAYTFANLAPGEYLLQVSAQGYTQAMMHGVPAGDMHVDFVLKSSHYEVAGRVVDAVTNTPVQSFEVAWFHFDHTRWDEDNPVMSAATLFQWKPFQNENGRFTLPIDWYVQWTTRAVLIVRAHGYGMALRVVDLGASSQQAQEFRLQPGGRLEGIVLNEAGQPVKNVVVFFDVGLTGFTERAAATTNADGLFSIENFPQAEQRLAFCHPEYAKAFVTVSGNTAPLAPLNVTLVSGGSIQASIEGGEPGATWQVSVFSENRFKELASAESSGGGTFTINRVAPGQATVQVYSRGPNFRTVMIEHDVVIEPGAAAAVEFIVPEGDAALTGVIEVGEQRPQTFRVTARYALDDGSVLTHMALGRNDGAYEILGLPQGNATVEVEATMQDGQIYTESRDIVFTVGGEQEADFDFSR